MAKVYAKASEQVFKVTKDHPMKGQIFVLEKEVSNLEALAEEGNISAKNALRYEKYTPEDGPFYYGRIKSGCFIIAAKHLRKFEKKPSS